MTGALRRLSPWSPAESRRLLALVLVGLVVVGVAWWITSREAAWDSQTDGMLIAVAGAMIAAYGATSWLLRARAVCAARRRVMFSLVPGMSDLDAEVVNGRAAASALVAEEAGPAEHVVAHPEQGRFHRPGCALASGDWPVLPRAEVADRQACGVCQP